MGGQHLDPAAVHERDSGQIDRQPRAVFTYRTERALQQRPAQCRSTSPATASVAPSSCPCTSSDRFIMCLRSSGLLVLSVLGPPGLVAAPVRYRANRVPRSWSGCHPVAPNPRITSHASDSPRTGWTRGSSSWGTPGPDSQSAAGAAQDPHPRRVNRAVSACRIHFGRPLRTFSTPHWTFVKVRTGQQHAGQISIQ
jgi:hypothetical protein